MHLPNLSSLSWACQDVCGNVSFLGHNTTVCCVQSCKEQQRKKYVR